VARPHRTGDPVSNGPGFKQDASNTADERAQQWGMHNDGLVYFPTNIVRSSGVTSAQRVRDQGVMVASPGCSVEVRQADHRPDPDAHDHPTVAVATDVDDGHVMGTERCQQPREPEAVQFVA
jgi:hypothetical protein